MSRPAFQMDNFGNDHRAQQLGHKLVISGFIVNNVLVVWDKTKYCIYAWWGK